MKSLNKETQIAKPFLKWAGGKGQLIPAIEATLPPGIDKRKSLIYVEPFIGSGAVMFWFLQKFKNVRRAIINDVNPDLSQAYSVIKQQPGALIERLQSIQDSYYQLKTEPDKKSFYLEKREEFNTREPGPLNQTALLIFLNKTCFNGLYRVNSKNEFNVPFGRYQRPKICDPQTILADSNVLKKVTILNGDYASTLKYATRDAFYYFDPPYKPISKTSSFNSYAKETFDDRQQIRLKQFCDQLSEQEIPWLLSNSDPKNEDPMDNFFDDLYGDDAVYIKRIPAKRAINSNAAKRGSINELLICNYKV